jgi:hypothetical protein
MVYLWRVSRVVRLFKNNPDMNTVIEKMQKRKKYFIGNHYTKLEVGETIDVAAQKKYIERTSSETFRITYDGRVLTWGWILGYTNQALKEYFAWMLWLAGVASIINVILIILRVK